MTWFRLDREYVKDGWRSVYLRDLTLIRCHRESDMRWFLRLIPCENAVFVPMDTGYPQALTALGCYPSASQAIKDGKRDWPENWEEVSIGRNNMNTFVRLTVWTTTRPWRLGEKLDQLLCDHIIKPFRKLTRTTV